MRSLLKKWNGVEQLVKLPVDAVILEGILCIPEGSTAIIVFVHGSGSSRLSSRNQFVATGLNTAGFATLLFDLLTEEEEAEDAHTAQLRFNIDLLSKRVLEVTKWLGRNQETAKMQVGYFGASTGAAAALVAASELPGVVKAVVSRGGRPELAGAALSNVFVPTLLIVGEQDPVVLDLNYLALRYLPSSTEKTIEIVPDATHLFKERGALEQVENLAAQWFKIHLVRMAWDL